MNIEKVIEEFRWELRNLEWSGEVLEHSALVTRRTILGQSACQLTCFAISEENADQAIREEVVRAHDLGLELEWKVFSFDSLSFIPRLESAGFNIGEREAVVVYDLKDGLAAFKEHNCDSIHRIVNSDKLSEFEEAYTAAFDRDCSDTVAQLAEAIKTGQSGHDAFLAYVNGVPASVGRLYTNPDSAFAGLYGAGTAPLYRGQGLYKAMVAARARQALQAGARFLLVDAMPTSLPILLRLGFVRVAETWPCTLIQTNLPQTTS